MVESNQKRERAGKRRRFTREFKEGAVRLALEEGKSIAELSRDLGVHRSVIGNWVRRAESDRGKGPAGALTTAEREELARLRKENRELRMERELLKNASGPAPYRLLRKKLGASTLAPRRAARPSIFWCSS